MNTENFYIGLVLILLSILCLAQFIYRRKKFYSEKREQIDGGTMRLLYGGIVMLIVGISLIVLSFNTI